MKCKCACCPVTLDERNNYHNHFKYCSRNCMNFAKFEHLLFETAFLKESTKIDRELEGILDYDDGENRGSDREQVQGDDPGTVEVSDELESDGSKS